MARLQNQPLRPVTEQERYELERVARATRERTDRSARARMLLAVADGAPFTVAARVAGRRAGDSVAKLVARFNVDGLAVLDRRHGGGFRCQYGALEKARIMREVARAPDRERDGTATWSLTTLQRALRTAEDGLPGISTFTILQTLWAAGYGWQRNRTWCITGTSRRKRSDGSVVTVTDPDAAPKKS